MKLLQFKFQLIKHHSGKELLYLAHGIVRWRALFGILIKIDKKKKKLKFLTIEFILNQKHFAVTFQKIYL